MLHLAPPLPWLAEVISGRPVGDPRRTSDISPWGPTISARLILSHVTSGMPDYRNTCDGFEITSGSLEARGGSKLVQEQHVVDPGRLHVRTAGSRS